MNLRLEFYSLFLAFIIVVAMFVRMRQLTCLLLTRDDVMFVVVKV